MNAQKLITELKKYLPETQVYFNDLNGGRIEIDGVKLETPDQARAFGGIETTKPVAVIAALMPKTGLG